ncbi:MAG: hypothetical protein EP346_13735 [Bacteroidetes bacterium]|nr:MAG: hypothetical protein EP346_13735 [Bacteroidota bacterium]
MNWKSILSILLASTLFVSCIEGPEIEQKPFNRVPDGRYAVVFQHQISPSVWVPLGMDSAQYCDYLIQKFGEYHDLVLRRPGSQQIVYTFSVPTVSKVREGECVDLDGAILYLYEDDYEIYDDDSGTFPRRLDRFYVRATEDDCILIQFPAE